MQAPLATLYYVHDPMCSWCWGFRPVWNEVQLALGERVNIRYLLAGLAPDTQQPMPESMQLTIRETWRRIQREIPGIKFNYDFWSRCQPRRSTYPACRAVIAAGLQGEKFSKVMILAIQQAYYLQARNPSDAETLLQLAAEIGLDESRFKIDLSSKQVEDSLKQELLLTAELEVSGYPALVLSCNDSNTLIHIDYNDSEMIISSILEQIESQC